MKISSVSNNQYSNNAHKAKNTHDKALQNIAANRALSGTDSANLVIANSLLSQSNVLQQGVANANDAIGMLNIADSTLSNLTDSANKLNELSVSINNPALSQREKNMIHQEANALKSSMQQSINNASFNGKNIFNNQLEFSTGNTTHGINLDANSINGSVKDIDITSQSTIENFTQMVNSIRKDIGSSQNALVSDIENSLKQHVALRQSESNLQNNDIALNISEERQSNHLITASILAQAHNTETLRNQIDRLLA